ncbi:DUF6626 family protein [Pseudohongiella sp.]|uniref:DUF6626 family protein n=1 Tax=Pseudohongiella sp. TaxID=1979412 RepID=UPI0034A03397
MTRTETVEAIKVELSKRELRPISDNEFSKQYLNRSRSYLAVMKHKNIDISESALLALYRNLASLSSSWMDIAASSPLATTSRAWQNHSLYKRLSETVWQNISQETIL